MRNLSEVHGIDLIRRVAQERLKDPAVRNRVWSDEMHSWGFFASTPNEMDAFLIFGCAQQGDMFRTLHHNPNIYTTTDYRLIENPQEADPYLILELKKFEVNGVSVYGLEMLASNPPMICQMLAEHKALFKFAWESL